MRYALAVLGLTAIAIAFVVSQSRGPDGLTIMFGFALAGVVLLTGAVIVARLDRITRLLRDHGRD